MGAGSSIASSGQIDTKLIDKIASEYILSMNFQDMKNMNTEAGCSKMVLVMENILKQHTTEVPLSDLETASQGLFNLAAPPSGEESIFVFPEGDEQEKKIMDVSDAKRKQLICRNIAKFYVQIAHIFAAIIMTVNPKYQYSDEGKNKTVSVMDKKTIPDAALSSASIILEKNYCSERESLLSEKSNLDDNNNISISVPYCNLNNLLTPIGEAKGIKDLEDLFKDEYDANTGIFTMSAQSKKAYETMIQEFYNAMHNSGSAPASFGEFKLPKYDEERGCSDTALQKILVIDEDENDAVEPNAVDPNAVDPNAVDPNVVDPNANEKTTIVKENEELQPPYKETYKGTNSGLYKDFKNNIMEMKETTAKNTADVFSMLDKLFNLKNDPITLNPEITPKTIGPLLLETREKISKLYVDCEKYFQKGLEIFRNIVYQNLNQQLKKEVVDLTGLEDRILTST